MSALNILKKKFEELVKKHNFEPVSVNVRAFPLGVKDAIGCPQEKDYPLVRGKEHLMEADFKGAKGQAYTDLCGSFEGTLAQVLELPLENNYERAVLISTLNAVLRYLGLIGNTVHCKDEGPRRCSLELVEFISRRWGMPKVALIGLQPRMAEALSERFPLRIADMDPENLGRSFGRARVESPEGEEEILKWCDVAVVTGTVLTNETLDPILKFSKKVIFYGVTVAGAAHLMQWPRFCPFST